MTYLRLMCLLWCLYTVVACATGPGTGGPTLKAERMYHACAFTLQPGAPWRRVAAATQQSGYGAVGLHFEREGVSMVVRCVPRDLPLTQWAQHHVSLLANDYTSFRLEAEAAATVQGAPAYWFLYSGRHQVLAAEQHGYMLAVERGGQGLIVAFAAEADAEHDYSGIFRSGVDTIRLAERDG